MILLIMQMFPPGIYLKLTYVELQLKLYTAVLNPSSVHSALGATNTKGGCIITL